MAFYFESLIVWQKAFSIVEKIYTLLQKFPKEETYALADQMRRASVSIPSNIAEWTGRKTLADKNHFFSIAQWSAMELQTQLLLAKKIWYITESEQQEISSILEEVVKMLVSMSKNDKRFISSHSSSSSS